MPKSLQPNKSILLKAIDDANHSVQQRLSRSTNESEENKHHIPAKSRLGPILNDTRNIEMDNEYNENKQIDTKFIVTLKGVNEKDFLSKHDDSRPFKRSLSNDDDEDNEMIDDYEIEGDELPVEMNIDNETNDENNRKTKVRCTFWPSCDKGDQCPFIHPNKPCE